MHISYHMEMTIFKPFLRGQQVKVKGRHPALPLINCMNLVSCLTYLTRRVFLGTIKQLDHAIFVTSCPDLP